MAVVVVRLLFDPLNLSDYWMPLCMLSLIGVGLRTRGDTYPTIGCVLLLAYLLGLRGLVVICHGSSSRRAWISRLRDA